MTTTVLVLALAAVALALAAAVAADENVWEDWKVMHGKAYAGAEEEAYRRGVWEANLAFVRQHNGQAAPSYVVHMNKFADLTNDEFRARYLAPRPLDLVRHGTPFRGRADVRVRDLPPSVDWRTQGWVTPIKNQGQCGSCWAFSTTGSLEGQHAKKTGQLVSLSEQNLVDCSGSFGNQGCDGGLMDYAFQYIKANKGIDTEDSYPYTGQDGSCQFNPANIGANLTGYVDVTSGDEQALQEATATVGPISVAIDASSIGFQLYKYGVYRDPFCSTTDLDHGVLVAGYGNDTTPIIGGLYYLVKNSWGADWGKDGYIYMARNDNNMCGIATAASYPTV